MNYSGYLVDNDGNRYYPEIYPIGSIYMSVNNVNPSIYFGGKWSEWGRGRVPLGVDPAQNDFKTVEQTGGEAKHQITINEMPAHEHSIAMYNPNWTDKHSNSANNVVYGQYGDSSFRYAKMDSGNNRGAVQGGGNAHNNMPPYITCYMWKRVS